MPTKRALLIGASALERAVDLLHERSSNGKGYGSSDGCTDK
jgi:hypothetical protein